MSAETHLSPWQRLAEATAELEAVLDGREVVRVTPLQVIKGREDANVSAAPIAAPPSPTATRAELLERLEWLEQEWLPGIVGQPPTNQHLELTLIQGGATDG